jgi:hypothetical protein
MQGEQGSQTFPAAGLLAVDELKRNLRFTAIFQYDRLFNQIGMHGEAIADGLSQHRSTLEDVFGGVAQNGVTVAPEKSFNSFRDHDSAPVGGEKDDSVAQCFKHLVQIRL